MLNPTRPDEKNATIAEALGLGKFVICASQGFYEGVDMPGVLGLVIIDKAPMPLPSDPVMKARGDLAGKGREFSTVTVPYVAVEGGGGA